MAEFLNPKPKQLKCTKFLDETPQAIAFKGQRNFDYKAIYVSGKDIFTVKTVQDGDGKIFFHLFVSKEGSGENTALGKFTTRKEVEDKVKSHAPVDLSSFAAQIADLKKQVSDLNAKIDDPKKAGKNFILLEDEIKKKVSSIVKQFSK